jgi:hypothetical protein
VLVTRAGATDAAKLPPWPDPGLFLVEANAALIPAVAFARVPGPAYLDAAETARTFLTALENAPSHSA